MRRIRRWVDAETVRLPQAIVYCAYIVAGVQSLALGAPPNAVAQAMGHEVALMWTALIIACPTLTLVGLWQRRRAFSLWLQLAGDSGVTFASAAYVVAVLQATWSERATFAAWSAAALAICGALVTWRDARRIRQVSKRIQAFEEGCARE